ncbi:MAG TPA: hypothetical protein VL551_35185 [Actinospica sp.]|nr:hypothetical protein [Actinospica sp.]
MTRTGRRYTGVFAAGAMAALAAGCAQTPADPPLIQPTTAAVAAHQDQRITLPVTVAVAFHHPALADRTEYAALFTVQQAMRSMVQAEYTGSGQSPELAEYWTGSGLTTVTAQIRQWTAHQLQPVGTIVLEDTAYTPVKAGRSAKVSFCADWSHVVRGESRTHVVGTAVQAKNVRPTYEELGVSRQPDRRWKVDSLTVTPNAPRCPKG